MTPTKDIFSREAQEIINDIRSKLSSTSTNATGKSSKSLEFFATEERLLITGGQSFGPNRRGESFIEGGRGAGRVPPFLPIAEWAIARGIIEDKNRDKKTVDAIRFGIMRKGTRLFQGNSPRDIVQSIIDEERTDDIINQVSGVYARDILSEIAKAFKK